MEKLFDLVYQIWQIIDEYFFFFLQEFYHQHLQWVVHRQQWALPHHLDLLQDNFQLQIFILDYL